MEDHCTIQDFRIAVKEDTQGLKVAATAGIRRDPDTAMAYAENFSRRIATKSCRGKLVSFYFENMCRRNFRN